MRKALRPHPLETNLPKIIEAYRQFPEPHVPLPHPELPPRVTHGCAAIAAAARLMEHQRAVRGLETTHDLRCFLGDENALNARRAHGSQKKPSALGE